MKFFHYACDSANLVTEILHYLGDFNISTIPLYYYSNVSRFRFKAKFIIYGFDVCLYFHYTFSFYLWFVLFDMVFLRSDIWYLISAMFNVFSVFYQFPKKWPNKMDSKIHDTPGTHTFRIFLSLFMVYGTNNEEKFFLFITFQILSEEKLSAGHIEWAKIERSGREFSIWLKRKFNVDRQMFIKYSFCPIFVFLLTYIHIKYISSIFISFRKTWNVNNV